MQSPRPRLLSVLLVAALISLPTAAFAQDDGTLESIDGEGTPIVEAEMLGTLDDYRWMPVGIGRTMDMLLMRPAALALTTVSALTFSVAVIPSLIRGDDERTSALYTGLIRDPLRYAILRPPFSAPDHFALLEEAREAEEALAAQELENARLEAEEARAAARAEAAAARAAAAAKAAAASAREAGSASDGDGRAEAGEEPPL